MIRRVLVANRGEIAVRVVRACREAGIGAVAVHEPDDAHAMHVAVADDAAAVPSYLDAGAILAAAARLDADAIHPGYGYLAESAAFAERVARAGLTWIGPPPEAMRLLGDKVEARRLAEAAGVPTVPGYAGVDLSEAALLREAERLGAPLMVKASAGGGGRGMRLVAELEDLPAALAAARREAAAAFGDDRLFLERAVTGARHVEIQLLADAHGGAVHLGERDCSVQRRHQKVIEESPSPAVDEELRAALGAAAVAVARAASYAGAGTVEFLLAGDGRWWFLELNARLQVEHPVTEAVAGLDLVRAQLAVAAGEPLELEQDEVALRGHAIEVRLYAEDPGAGFLPTAGRVERLALPAWPGVRVDTALREGDVVGTRYDPLLVKVIAHAEDRDACVERLAAALADTAVLGLPTNLGFVRWALDHPDFRAGAAGLDFVERAWSPALVPPLPDAARALAAAAAAPAGSVWHELGPRPGPVPDLVVGHGFAQYRGHGYRVGGDEDDAGERALAPGTLAAPMPGAVLRVLVEAGEAVTAGQTLVLLEAMKMELPVTAPADGVVREVRAAPGRQVARGDVLVEVDAG